jgi:hypothetical protein
LLVAFVLLALGLTAGIKFRNWLLYVPLDDLVAEFNARVLPNSPPVTVDEIINYIKKELPELAVSEKQRLYVHILRTGLVPKNARITYHIEYGAPIDSAELHLKMGRYRILIREHWPYPKQTNG